MTGTGRRWPMVGVGVLVAAAVALTGWSVLSGGDGDDGSDTTPTPELTWVARLADLVQVDDASQASPAAIGTALGDVVSLLRTPQDVATFAAGHGIGPLDMASQLGSTLASVMYDVAPPSACGIRAGDMRAADTQFVLGVSASAVTAIERDQDPAAVAALILPVAIEGDQRETIAEHVAGGRIDAAARAVEHELGDEAAALLVRALVEELTGVLAADDDADYLASFQSSYTFASSVMTTGTDCS